MVGNRLRRRPLISRSALGITASGALVWAAGTDVTVGALADALLAQGVQRALELDIQRSVGPGLPVRRAGHPHYFLAARQRNARPGRRSDPACRRSEPYRS